MVLPTILPSCCAPPPNPAALLTDMPTGATVPQYNNTARAAFPFPVSPPAPVPVLHTLSQRWSRGMSRGFGLACGL